MHNRTFIAVSQDEIKGKGKQIDVREEAGRLTDNRRELVQSEVEQTQRKAGKEIGKPIEVTRRTEWLSSGVRVLHSSYLTDLDLLPPL
jgi:uncharacterized protein YjbJ (UPF0337 family)